MSGLENSVPLRIVKEHGLEGRGLQAGPRPLKVLVGLSKRSDSFDRCRDLHELDL